jgi:hypothetical protein
MAAAAECTSRKRPRKPKTPPPNKLRVLSIDVGLRNLGLALLEWNRGGAEGEEEDSDTARCIVNTTAILHAENVDVLEENGCTAKNAKTIGPLKQVSFWHSCMMSRSSLILETPPDIVVVEVQDGGNATMRQVSTGIVGLFMGHFEARFRDGHIPQVPQFTMVRGDMKMKICRLILGQAADAEGEAEPEAKAEAEPEAKAEAEPEAKAERAGDENPLPPEYLKVVNPKRYYAMLRSTTTPKTSNTTSGRSRQAYEARKRMSVHAFETYMESNEPVRRFFQGMTHKKRRDIADAIFQGMYVVCRELKADMG